MANIPRRAAADLSGPAAQLACFTLFKPQKPVQNALGNWRGNRLSAINLQVILEEIVICFD
ncbi:MULTISPECIES: hypothetical protein [Rhizobium]|uniref:hypothetical protein n=1 Tax=Rhizobium TaxID=379 RepID=UPI001013D77A|nr:MULTISPECIES: hypothetical protein [Rhizobium]MBB4509924.1 hypothetical protein [Rhizobium leguminosarum]MBY5373974.1 hypothetical protein [Rhizobium leguminosarum]MBY5389387.1 hypothetical protein [Rhizobium leguminosarum]MBY5420451.1 hypothetical protein [Rhizobium leguminosarum]MBY5432047.1 hypothetical protein [Rhizobium leguminosarum]